MASRNPAKRGNNVIHNHMKGFLIPKTPLLSVNQLERLSNIFDNAVQVVFGLAVLSPIISGFDKINLFIVVSGVILVIICWVASLFFTGKAEFV